MPMNHAAASALHRVLAATDLSPQAATAAQRAAMLAQAPGARLRLLHVVGSEPLEALRAWLDDSGSWQVKLHQQASNALLDEAQTLATRFVIQVDTEVLDGQPVQAISEHAQQWAADLLVVAALGTEAGLRIPHLLRLGTTAERLLGKTLAPLLVVRTPALHAYKSVLVPLDFSPWSEHAIGLARQLAPSARLVLMHSFTVPFEGKLRYAGVDETTLDDYRARARHDALAHLQALVQAHGLASDDYALCLVEGEPPEHILRECRERGCDLIVIGKHGRQAADELLLGSVTKHVLAEAEIDVLVSTIPARA